MYPWMYPLESKGNGNNNNNNNNNTIVPISQSPWEK